MKHAIAGLIIAVALTVPATAAAYPDQGQSQVQLYQQAWTWANDMAYDGDTIYSFDAIPSTMWWDPTQGAWGAHVYIHHYSKVINAEILDQWNCLAMPGWNYCEGRPGGWVRWLG